MINKNLKKLVSILSNLDGISGREQDVSNFIQKELKNDKNLTFEKDALGSLAVIKKISKNLPNISITAHMDEVGFIVTKIDKEGFIYFTPVGGWWGHVLLGKILKIKTNDNKEFVGVVGSKPPHLLSSTESRNVVRIKNMFLDLGASSKEEVEKLGIKIGNQIVPYQTDTISIQNDRIIGKAHDDRVAIAAGIEIMRRLEKEKELNCNVYFIASVQEEIGLRGARTSAYKWTPDVAFALDVTIANDTPEIERRETVLGSGVALSIMDSSIISNPKLLEKVEQIAKKNKIKYTFDSLMGGGTDAGAIHLVKEGVITMTLSIPSRYIHSHNSIIDLKDVESSIQLIINFIKDFNKKTLEELKFS